MGSNEKRMVQISLEDAEVILREMKEAYSMMRGVSILFVLNQCGESQRTTSRLQVFLSSWLQGGRLSRNLEDTPRIGP